jgi:hypothetical protein
MAVDNPHPKRTLFLLRGAVDRDIYIVHINTLYQRKRPLFDLLYRFVLRASVVL